jgi:cystathionine beta-lyase/cystathionine gamma-synthase
MEPADRSTIWPYDSRGEPRRFYYSRADHPAGAAAETELARREGGEALLYASGMGAAMNVLLAFARPGSSVALAEGCYYGTSKLLDLLAGWGISYVEYDQRGAPPQADIVWVEAAANPLLTMPDWDALRRHPGLVVCDATIATPVYLRALDEGADVVVHSATKFLTGNHGALLGATVTRDPEKSARLRAFRTNAGIVAAPDAAAALLAGLETLDERMGRHTASATELAREAPGRLERAVPGLQRRDLVRRRGRADRRDLDEADPERDEPRRRPLEHGEPLPLGRRPHPGRAPAPLGRARGRQRPVGRPRTGNRWVGPVVKWAPLTQCLNL